MSSIYRDEECALQARCGMRGRIEAMSQRLMWGEITPAQVLGAMDSRGWQSAPDTIGHSSPALSTTCDTPSDALRGGKH